jgi:hypothetical protein
MGLKVVGAVGSSNGTAAPGADWSYLIDQLSGYIAQGVPFPGTVYLNESGSYLPAYRVTDVASICQTGNVWIDYCQWPMLIDITTILFPIEYEDSGFQLFSELALGSPLDYGNSPPQFSPPLFSGLYRPGGVAAALFTTTDLTQTPGVALPYNFTGLPYDPPLVTEPNTANQTVYVAPMFGLQFANGAGWYFWAAAQSSGSGVIDPGVFANFIASTVSSPSTYSPNGSSPVPAPTKKGKGGGAGLPVWEDALLIAGGVGAGLLLLDFGFHYFIAKAGASRQTIFVGRQ